MSVVLHDGGGGLKEGFGLVLDELSPGIDWTRGVFLKPNIVFPARPDSGQVTPPSFVAAFVQALRERHERLDIIMGDGVAVGGDPQENFRVSGYAGLARELGIPLLDLHESERAAVPWQFGELELPQAALERVYVSMPILKDSSACVISGAMKNQKGLLAPAVKKQFHRLGLDERIAALNTAVRPSLTVMDCSPFFGPCVLLAGDNCGEIDATACRLLEIAEPAHVQLARSAGLFTGDFPVLGDEGAVARRRPRPEPRPFKSMGRLRLWSNPQACTGCRALFRAAREDALRPGHLAAKGRLLGHAAKGAEIVMGLNPEWRREHEIVICVGDCTRRLAGEHGYAHVPGCPPTLDDLYERLP